MMPEKSRREDTAAWLVHAKKDLNAARVLIPIEPSCATFHCQQAAEKSAKAFLTFHEVVFRKTHDMKELGKQCAQVNPELEPMFKDASDLNDYAVVFRYLDAPHEPDEEEAKGALEIAQRVFDVVQRLTRSTSATA